MSKPSSKKPASLRDMGDRTRTINHPKTGKPYSVGSLQLEQLMQYEEWLGDECVKRAKHFVSQAGDVLSEDYRTKVMADAFEESKNILLSTPEGLRMTESLRGMTQMLFLCIRRLTPGVTLKEVLELITPDNLKEITLVLDTVAGLSNAGSVGNAAKKEGQSTGD